MNLLKHVVVKMKSYINIKTVSQVTTLVFKTHKSFLKKTNRFIQKSSPYRFFDSLIKTVFTQSKALIEGRGIGK